MSVNWLHFCVFLFVLSIVLIYVVSLFTRKPREDQIREITYGSATPEQLEETRQSWDKWDVIHSLVIVSVIVAFYAYFW